MAFIRSFVAGSLVAAVLVAEALPRALAQDQTETDAAQAETEAPPSNIDRRLRRIEDELIDMRAMVGALQSFTSSDEGASLPGGFSEPESPPASAMEGERTEPRQSEAFASGPSGSEISQLEIQIQALSAQLSEAVRRLGRLEQAVGLTPGAGSETADESETQAASPEAGAPETGVRGFGTTTVEPPEDGDRSAAWSDAPASGIADGAGDPQAQAAFTQAYDAFLAQDYAAARTGFESFIETYPDDPLTNDARFWLADAAFAEGDYVAAANNFVKVYNTAPRGEKSEETLLKLAITLRRLDRPESACDALSRLEGRLDGKPDVFRERVENERSRSGCS